MPDNISKLYQELKGTYELGSENDFRKYLSDGKKREALRKELEADYEVGDSASFTKYLGLDAQPQQQPQQTAPVQQQPKPQQNLAVTSQPSKPQPIQMPQGFGELDLQQAQRMGMGKGPVSWNEPGIINPTTGKSEPKQEKNIAKDLDKALKGDKEAAKRSGLTTAVQRMQEEREYAEATGKPLRNIVNTPVTAPTAVKGEDGQMLMGQTTDEQRVAQYQQQEREIERKKIIQPIVDDIQRRLEEEVLDTTMPGIMQSGNQYQAMMNQNTILQKMNQADSPEKLWGELQKYFDSEQFLVEHEDEIAQGAARLGMNVDDFVWQELIPKMSGDIAQRFNQNMSEKYSVKDTGDYLAKRMINSSIGALARMSAGMTPQQSQFMQEGLQKSNEGMGEHFNARWYDKAVGEIAQFAPDAPLMLVGGAIGGGATKLVGAGLTKLGAESLGALVANGSPLLAANVGKAVKYGGLLGNRILGSAANMGSFMGLSGMLQAMASTDSTEDGYWSSIGLAGLEGLEEGAKMGTALGGLGMAGGKLSSLASTAKGRAAIASGAFLAENQIFALSDYLADPEKYNWVDSSLDAFYMMMAGRVTGMMTHGTEGMKRSFANILYGEPTKGMPRLTDDEKAIIQRAFGGIDFVDIAGDVNNIGKILSDKENIPLNVRQKISGATMGAFEPNRPHTYMTSFRGNEIHERAKDGELLAVHKFADTNERDQILQEIADRKANDEMISYYNILNLRNQAGLTDALDGFCKDYQLTLPEAMDIMGKKPVERTFEEQNMMDDLSKRLHDTAFPEGELHPAQSAVDGANAASSGPVADPNVSAEMAQSLVKAVQEYNDFMEANTDVRDGIARLGDARPDEILLHIANNYSGSQRDEGLRVVSNFYNAKAKRDGYVNKVGDNINNYVDQEIESSGFKGVLDGNPDVNNIITVTDGEKDATGQPRKLTLLNGEIGTTFDRVVDPTNGIEMGGARRVDPERSGGQIICRDENGQFVILKPDTKITILDQMPKEDYANNLREELGVENTTTLVETGLVEPQVEGPGPKEASNEMPPTGQEGEPKLTITEEQPVAEAGDANVTGANDATVAPVTPEPQPAVEIPVDKEGSKRYEQVVMDFDTAIDDMRNDVKKDEVVKELIDSYITEAKEKQEKLKDKKPTKPAEVRKKAIDMMEAEQALAYYKNLKERYNQRLATEKALKDAEQKNNKPQNSVPLQPQAASERPKSKTADEKRAERIVQLKQQYGEDFDDDFTKAQSAEELASMYVGRNRVLSRESISQELGYKIGGIGHPLETLLAKTGEGKTTWEVAHAAYESDENPTTGEGEKMFSDKEIHDALISLFQGAQTKADIMDYAINVREERAKRLQEERKRAEEEAKASGEAEIEPFTEEELKRMDAEKPFGDPTEDDFPELPKSKQDQLVEEVSKILDPEVPASVVVIDANRTSDKDWYDIASEAYGGVFPSEEDIAKLKEWMQDKEGGYMFVAETGKLYTADHVSIDKIKELYKEIKEAYERAKEEETNHPDTRTGQADERVDDSERQDRGVEGQRQDEGQGEGGAEPDREPESSERDEYLKPRNEKEKKIVADVEAKLAEEIKQAKEEVRKAKSAYDKARNKESERATDMFSDDKAFEEPGQLFSFDDMGGTDRSQEGVDRRTEAERNAYKDADKKLSRLLSKEEHDSRVRGALDNERKQTSFEEPSADPMEAIEQSATEFKKEQDAQIGVTHNETEQEVIDNENAKKLVDEPLTTDEIDNADVSDVQKTLAKDYLNGNHDILEEGAYLNIYNHVRTTRRTNEGDSPDAERGAQLASGVNQQESGLGRAGERTGEPASERDVPEQNLGGTDQRGVQRVENSEDNISDATRERGNSSVSQSEPAVDGVHTGGEQSGRGSGDRSDGYHVRRPGDNKQSSGMAAQAGQRKPKAGSDAAITASKQRLAELRAKFKKAGRNGELSISLVGMNQEQIGILMDITTEAANLGYQYLAKGLREFKEWSEQMLDDFHDWLQEDMKWSDAEINEYINKVWNCKYNIDGVTRTIREWASFMGEQKLREVVREDLETKFEKQKAAESIEVKTGDIDNIRETLPYLLPEQQDDVLKTETQFFDPSHQDREHGFGKGMMFTNGTGTGKTYTGLGIVKRFVKQGKGRVLILTPSQPKVSDWKKDGLNLGLNIEDLDTAAKAKGTTATKAKGKGVVVTTYANARQNLALLEDCFDLIVYDESHKILENKEAAEGEMFKFHQMLTNKDVESSIDRQTYWLPEWIEYRNLIKEREENEKKLNTLSKLGELTEDQKNLQQRLNARELEIQSRIQEMLPIMQEIRESKREQAEIDSKLTKTVFLSATPFNKRENLKYAEGYLFSYPEEDPNTVGSYNHRNSEDAFFERYFPAGYRWRYGRLEQHVENAEALGRQEIDFSDYLQNQLGTLSGRMITSEWDYSRDFPVLTLDHAGRFNQAMSEVYRNKKYNAMSEAFHKAFDYNYSTALFEAMKTSLVIERMKEHLNRGQKVVVFHRRQTSKDLEPPFERALQSAELYAQAELDKGNVEGSQKIKNAIHAFREDFADMLKWEKTIDYTLPRDQIEKVFGKDKIGFFSGTETKKAKGQSIEDFMKDNGGKDIIVIQEASGKEGISLHDKTGEHQRVEINLALPQSPIAFIQIEGRIYRIGQKSNAIFEYPLLGLDLETSLFAQKFNSALGTTENLALGSKARNLRQSIANAVLENSGEIDYDRQGFGGKDMDGQVDSRGTKDGFDNAISDYYGNHKMKKGHDNREGFDYFPTPEPVGWKMVQWAQLMEGESALEPSAGHGAIARYVPETNPLTAIEPSAELFSKLQMRAGGPGRKFEEKSFEDYPIANKHDAIVMNPPYGVQGKMAMDHVAKAFKHLNEGGRLIAIIPDGPAMEKRLDAWLRSSGTEGLNGAAVVTGEVKLPDVAFSRAGTSVRTRIVVIDKVTRPKMREGMPDKVTVDLSGVKTVDELFEQLRNVNMPERTIDQAAIAQKRALRTKKAFEDNRFVSYVDINESGIRIENRSSYGSVPSLKISFEALATNPAHRESLLIQFAGLRDARENVETLDYGKWKNKTYGSGKNAIPAVDAIRDYCDTAIKTIANVLKTTEDGLDKEWKAYKAEQERKCQEREAEIQRKRDEAQREKDEKVKGIVDRALAENPDNPFLTPGGIENNIKIAHSNIYMMAEKAKRRLREAGIDWQTGEKLIDKATNLEKAYRDDMPLDLETMKRLMKIAENGQFERADAAKRALEMSGVHSDTGEIKEGFDFSSHDEHWEKELRGLLEKASLLTPLKTKQQLKESGVVEQRKERWQGASQPAKKESYEYKLDKNTRTGEDMHLVVMNDRVDDNTYKELQRKAKALNDGYYNRFKKAWHFKTEADARKFAGELNGTTREDGTTTRFRLREKEAPKKTKKVYKLVRRGSDNKAYPLFIDSASPMELGNWYDADSPNVKDLEKLEPGFAYKIDRDGNVVETKPVNRTKTTITGLPNVQKINEATNEESRWITVTTDKKGGKTYHNVGINGSGQPGTFAMRPGWHAGSLPSMRQIGKGKDRNLRDDNFVWVEGEVPADVDYQAEAESNPFKDIPTHIPEDGYYLKATNVNKAASQADRIGWYVAGAFKPNRYLSDSEARKIIDDWNAEHPDQKVEYDFERESGRQFNAETMQLEEPVTRMRSNGEQSQDGQDVNPVYERNRKAGEKLAKSLNTDFEALTDISQIKNKKVLDAINEGEEVPGWVEFDKDGKPKIFMFLPHVRDTYDAQKTIAHEVIGHKGLRELLGEEGYKSYMRTLALDLKDEKLSDYMRDNMARHGFDIYTTIDEYLAEAAEKGYGNLPMWQKVRDAMANALRKAGFEMTPSISDVKYMIWLSKNQLQKGEPISDIKREALLYRLGKERYEAKVKNGEFTFEEFTDNEVPPAPYMPETKTLFRSTPSAKTAKQQYEEALHRLGYAWKEAHVDRMQGAIELMRAMTGVKRIEDIPSVENFVLAENQMSSKEEQQDYLFWRDKMQPLDKAVAAILPDMGKNVDDALRNLQLYMIKKSGLERNRVLYVRDKIREYRSDPDMDKNSVNQLEDDWNMLLDQIRDDIRMGNIDLKEYLENMDAFIKAEIDPGFKTNEHDYSGLTDMYGKGYDDADITDEVMSTESMIGDERIKDLWEKTKTVSQFGLDTEYEGGLDSKDKHDKVSRMFEWYVPLRGHDETTAEEVYDYFEEGKKGRWAGPVLMNAKGRESLSDVDIFAQLGAMSSYAIHRSLENQMKQTFARFVRNHYDKDGNDRLVTELKYLWGKKGYDTAGNEIWTEEFPDIPEGAKADDVAQILDQYEQDMKALESQGLAKKIRQNSTIPFRPAEKAHKAQHIVEAYINGEKKVFVVNGNPRAAQAVNGMTKSERRGNFAYLSSLQHTIAKLATSYNPDFIISNAERDAIFSASAIGIKENPRYFGQWIANYVGRGMGRSAASIPLTKLNLFNRYRNNELDMSNPTDRYFKEFMENGGETGWVESKNIDKWKKLIKDNVKEIRGQITKEDWQALKNGKLSAEDMKHKLAHGGKKVLDLLPHAVEAMNERAENMARFATYMTSRQMGRTITRSVSDAKEVSVNFNRKGAGYKTRDMYKGGTKLEQMNALVAARTAQYGQDYIMFYNAGVQGLNNASKLFRDHPVKASTLFTGFALGAFVMSWLNQQLIDSEDPNEREGVKNPYAELPEYIRRNNLCLYTGNGGFAIVALPIELRALYGIGDMAAGMTQYPELKSDKPVWQDVMTQLTQVLPIDFMGEHPGNPIINFLPSGGRPIAEILTNQNWYGRPIEKESYGNDDKPRHTRAYKNTNKAYVDAAKKWNAATNKYSEEDLRQMGVPEENITEADYMEKGLDGWLTDPAIAQHIVESYLAGLGKTAGNIAHITKMAKDGSNIGDILSSEKMPILRKFHYAPTEQNKMARTRNKWFHYKEEMEQTRTDMNTLKKLGAHDPLEKMKEISKDDSLEAVRAEQMEKALKKYNKLRKALDKTKDSDTKDSIQMRMDQLMENTVIGLDSIR